MGQVSNMQPDLSASVEQTVAFAETLGRTYVSRGGNPVSLFAAAIGLVCQRDHQLARDCLTAMDRFLSGEKPE